MLFAWNFIEVICRASRSSPLAEGRNKAAVVSFHKGSKVTDSESQSG